MKPLKFVAAAAFSLAALAPLAARAQGSTVLLEGFNNFAGLRGWEQVNNSVPAGSGWFEGNEAVFRSHAGLARTYAATNYLGAENGVGSIDNWLITPALALTGTTVLTFFTRAASDPGYADNIEVLFSAGSGFDTSGFSTLGTIGPNGFPTEWTQFTSTLDFEGTGRFAFRYLGDAGALNYIGIDTVKVVTAVPEPSLYIMLGLGLGALAFWRRKFA